MEHVNSSIEIVDLTVKEMVKFHGDVRLPEGTIDTSAVLVAT